MTSIRSSKRILVAGVLLAVSACTVTLPPERPDEHIGSEGETMPAPAPAIPSPPEPQALETTGDAETAKRSAVPPPRSPPQPIENIVVTGNGLSGYWRLTASSSIDIDVGLLSGVRILYSGAAQNRDICRIRNHETQLRATCVAGFAPTAEGSLDQQDVTLRWWAGPANVIFRGIWDDARIIQGSVTGGVIGLSVTGDVPAVMRKLAAPDDSGGDRPSAQVLRVVLADLQRGALTEGHYEGMAAKRLQPAFSWAGARASSHSLAYLGQIHIRWHRWQRETIQDVYDVESPDDHSLCRIALSERGWVTDFACQSEPPESNQP